VVFRAGLSEELWWTQETRIKVKSRFYQKAVREPVSNQKQKWTIFNVRCSLYDGIHFTTNEFKK
jgi:hypothetical protein